MNRFDLITSALRPLGDYKETKQGMKFNCQRCEDLGYPENKFNLEIKVEEEIFHCWACNYSGGLYKLINEKGYKEYLEYFQNFKDKKEKKVKSKVTLLPENLISVTKIPYALSHLMQRGMSMAYIVEHNIKYCFSGTYEKHIIFPSYDNEGKLNYWLALDLKTRKYDKPAGDSNILFWESFIDKNVPIVLVEGIFDVIAFPNCLPLLGLRINQYTLDFLANTEVILAVDFYVNEKLKKKLLKELKSTCKTVHDYVVPEKFKDPNDAFTQEFDFSKEIIKYYNQVVTTEKLEIIS